MRRDEAQYINIHDREPGVRGQVNIELGGMIWLFDVDSRFSLQWVRVLLCLDGKISGG